MRDNLPGVDIREAPYWTLTEKDEESNPMTTSTKYFCTNECVRQYLK